MIVSSGLKWMKGKPGQNGSFLFCMTLQHRHCVLVHRLSYFSSKCTFIPHEDADQGKRRANVAHFDVH